MKKSCVLIYLLLLYPVTAVYAVKVSSLYQVEIPVATQSVDERSQAVKQGFIEVLVKLSGDHTIEKNPVIKENLRRAEYFVQEFSYALPSTSSSQYLLQVNYNKNDINQLLKKADIAYWGMNRPLIIVWLTLTDAQHHTEIINNESPGNLLSMMQRTGKRFGLPLIFPVMDVTEVDQVSVNDVITRSLTTIQEASKRYAPDALLIGNMEKGDAGFQSRWQLMLKNNRWDFSISGQTKEDVVRLVMMQVSQALTKQYVVKEPQFWLSIQVLNVLERSDLVQLMQYLKQLALVKEVKFTGTSGNGVTLSLLVTGSLASFQENASIGQRLILKSQDDENNQFVYEWIH